MKKIFGFLMALILLLSLAACSAGAVSTSPTDSAVQSANSAATIATQVISTPHATAADALAEITAAQEEQASETWDDSTAIAITLDGQAITSGSANVSINGSIATITAAGTYKISGALTDGQIIVNTKDEAVVRLIMNGVEIHNSTTAPIYIEKAKEAMLVLADGTQNTFVDASTYVYASADVTEPNAAIFSNANLTIAGSGSLTVNGNFKDGITSEDGLIITSGTIQVTAADDGIRGKDYVLIKNGNITVNAQGDGIKSDNEEDTTQGYISVETGTLNITSGGDAIHAQTDVIILDGTFTVSSGGGSHAILDETTSAKGIKAAANVNIDNGAFTIDSADDTIHANGNIVINGGSYSLASGDDGLHADTTIEINGGDLQVVDSYEGIESAVITINSGNISVNSSDDGINIAAGVDGSGANPGMGPGGRPGGRGGPGQYTFTYSGSNYLYIHGGYIYVEAAGDGLDVNGAIAMTNGTLVVNGPTERMNGAIDYDGTFVMTGGMLVAAGSSGMAMAPSASSSQYSVLINMNDTQQAGDLFHIQNAAGEDILTFAPAKAYQSIAFSSPALVQGETYTVFVDGSSTGAIKNGLYQDVTYSPGTQYTSFTVSSIVTSLGSGGNRP